MTLDTANGIAFQISEEDSALVAGYRWHAYPHWHTHYVKSYVGNEQIYLHRLIAKPPHGSEVDHINRDGLDNRRVNLRVVSHALNMRNARLKGDSKTGLKGVSRTPQGRWLAYFYIAGKRQRIGIFDSPEVAARAYVAATADVRHP